MTPTSPNGAPILTGHALQKIKEQVEKEFAKARNIERRRFGRPAPTDPALYGRRKDDVVVEVIAETPKKLVPLSKQAAPLLHQIKATGMPHRCNNGIAMWDIGEAPEVSEADLPKLLESCEEALGFKKPVAERSCLVGEPEGPSIWKRDIFRMVKGAR
jgi:CTP:molybdopterin cytidylyltransferase MocA